MAERRMFAKTIIDSDAFLDMPLSTQSLYFHLSMRADDEGFINNPKKIQRMIGASEDDAKMLMAKNFVIPFDSGVVVIKHWKIHNYIRNDRFTPTKYKEERELLTIKDNGAYTLDFAQSDNTLLPPTDKRKLAYEESELPYSFDYKIRQAFYGHKCPICGNKMQGTVDEAGIQCDAHRPTIQHNIPISKGGKHELGNISVICHSCNVSLQDTETGELNNTEVIEMWDKICEKGGRQANGSQVVDKCQPNDDTGKDSIGKSKSKDKNIYGEFKNVRLKEEEFQKLKEKFPEDYNERIEALSVYMRSRGKTYKDHYATILNWARKEQKEKDAQPKPIEPKKYKVFEKEEYEREDFKAEEMPQELREKLGGMFNAN